MKTQEKVVTPHMGGCFHIIIEKYDFPTLPTEEEKEVERMCRVAEKVLELL